MAYFRVLSVQLSQIQAQLDRDDAWCILINADPDALASAMALKRLIRSRVKSVTIARVNDIARPDNLAMIRYLRIPLVKWRASLRKKMQRFAIVDSQAAHHPDFAGLEFSIIIDHHPLATEPAEGVFQDIRSDYGAVSTMMTEYLYTAGVRPSRLLATALQYGIRTDTGTFGRRCTEVDLRAYHFLSRFSDTSIMMRILRSEYLPEWLPYFSRAFETLRPCGRGSFAWLGKVKSPDILVVIADFFLKVHGLRWVAVCGVSAGRAVAIFRGGFGLMDLGAVASSTFKDIGGGGGHRNMARGEAALSDIPDEHRGKLEDYLFQRLYEAAIACRPKPGSSKAAEKAESLAD
jgi:nanoRNase/pAp phosphatase (c-di-AMP/oligoRNAs hydrolase)